MPTSGRGWCFWLLIMVTTAPWALGQSQPKSLPDAPQPQATAPPAAPPPTESSSQSDSAATPPVERHVEQPTPAPAPQPLNKPRVPSPNSSVSQETPDRNRLFKISTSVNFIEIPVTVKDSSGKMVAGLLPQDFTVYENGVRQKLAYFTSDPLPISAAVLIDVSMSDTALRRVQSGLQALQGAFSQFDQVAIYTYGNSVERETDFNSVNDRVTMALNRVIETKHGRQGGGDIGGGPFEAGPTVNGHPMDPSVPHTPIIPHDRRVLNDAVLEAALDLSKVPPARRRVIMIIGDGREDGSRASYADVLKILLTNKVSVYAIAVDSGAIPFYRKLETLNLPGTGNGNVLPKYANATGGEVFSELTRQAIESAYASVTNVARNQYTLGYYTQATLADNYREIEVRVDHPSLRISAKAGYYPLPPERH